MDVARIAKDTPKSQKTRARILDQAMRLIAEVGYHAASNPAIADAAGLTRGAMLYHFPTREALVEAAVAHIQAERSTLFRAAADSIPAGADVTEHAIDSYWDLLHSVPFQAFAELEAAGRADPAIQALLAPAQAEFDRAQAGDHTTFKILQAGAGPRFQASRDLARFMLEGLARSTLTYDKDGRKERLLAVIKRATHMLNRKGDVQDLWPE
ncbi:TetR/AcrR family transcriptional regulator [Caulobacter sp. RHG1]|uniref:TetR/AcrR family transcriptional regulator n=1 Tax=Caulobacter sp. (strain RHG1) TaxID=2545762 RepID=UPI001551A510|nr:TetR/AcrR family transcriptional regulator [Caulobacter sp. RHG1]NQE63555.1 Transcriptional regulator, AcrR family [Caulobacter sp. RHG1]